MTKNTIGGKGHKKGKKLVTDKKHIPFADLSTDYAFVLDVLGGGRMRVFCFKDNKRRIACVRGSMYKKVWVAKEDIVLISLRDFEDTKCDIVFKYESDDVSTLIKTSELPSSYSNIARGESFGQKETISFEDGDFESIMIDDI